MPFDHRGRRRGAGDQAAHLLVLDAGAQAAGALISMVMHDRRAAVVAHLVLADGVEDQPASTLRRQTWVPALAAMVHGKHQPLQWNIGSVHR
jgi:hypothetical protein